MRSGRLQSHSSSGSDPVLQGCLLPRPRRVRHGDVRLRETDFPPLHVGPGLTPQRAMLIPVRR